MSLLLANFLRKSAITIFMNVEEIKRIITSQHEEINDTFQRETIVNRQIPIQQLNKALQHPNILAILGVRRSGKSICSILLLKGKKYGYINFDDERIINIKTEELDYVLQAFYELYGTDIEYIILDEIQNVKNWELFANRLRRTKKVIITGSNSKLLSGELATHLTGRYLDFTLFPFSFNEFLEFHGVQLKEGDFHSTKKISEIKEKLRTYLSQGGFPETYKFGKAMPLKIYENIILKDILFRYKIKNKAAFTELAKYLVTNITHEISYAKLKNISAIKNVHTVRNYVNYISNAYLIIVLERFSFKLKNKMIAPKKIFCIDAGVIDSIAFKFSENFGKIMENTVVIDLLRRKSYEFPEMEIYYWKNHQQQEVDIVIKKGNVIEQLIQITAASEYNQIEKREYTSLLLASKELNCKNLLIITWDYEATETKDGKEIHHIPLWKWLLH